jgi:hypothetical protein
MKVSTQKEVPIKKDTLELLFSNFIQVGRWKMQYSSLSYSDSVFLIADVFGKSDLYVIGKTILKQDSILGYDSIAKRYHLKVFNKKDILKFAYPSLNYQFKENSVCTKLKSLNSKILFHSVMKSKSGAIFQFIVYENKTPILKICNSNRSYIFKIKNEDSGTIIYNDSIQSYTNSLDDNPSYIKLMDITGDGKEELFIFYDVVDVIFFYVYQINYLE